MKHTTLQTSPIFIVATPRSAAKPLAQWLSAGLENAPSLLNHIARQRDKRGITVRDKSDVWTAEHAKQHADGLLPTLTQRDGANIEFDPSAILRIAALAIWFPQARFVYLYRDVRETLALMLDAWQSGVQPHPSGVQLRNGMHWSLPLPPAWSSVTARPLHEIVAWQWASMTRIGLDSLQKLNANQWCVTSYDRLLAAPDFEYQRLSSFLGLPAKQAQTFQAQSAGLTSPDPNVWAHRISELEKMAPLVVEQANRAVALFAHQPQTFMAHEHLAAANFTDTNKP